MEGDDQEKKKVGIFKLETGIRKWREGYLKGKESDGKDRREIG